MERRQPAPSDPMKISRAESLLKDATAEALASAIKRPPDPPTDRGENLVPHQQAHRLF